MRGVAALFRSLWFRSVTMLALLTTLAGCVPAEVRPAPGAPPETQSPSPSAEAVDRAADFTSLETRFDARLGVSAIDTGTGNTVAWRAGERFAYASTFKVFAAAAVLDRVGLAGLDAPVPIAASDILSHSPVTETRVGSTMTVRELADAAITQSDNAAANHLLRILGGPQALDDALTALGDEDSMVSRTEPDLNEATPGDTRDTTTPDAFAADLREYVLGSTLSAAEREQLTDWLVASTTGATLVRAGVPADWTVGDKSGGGRYASRGDIAVIWPAGREPIVMAVLSSRSTADAAYDDRLIAQAASIAVDALVG